MMGRRRNGACPERKKGFFEARQTVVERVFEPILFLLFSGKGETDGIFFLLLQKENAWQKKKETGETFRMVSPDPFYRPEPCSGLAAYGSRRIYDRLCRGRCRAQLFATKERYRCGLPLAGTHRPFPAAADSLPCVKGGVGEADGGIVGRAMPAPTAVLASAANSFIRNEKNTCKTGRAVIRYLGV